MAVIQILSIDELKLFVASHPEAATNPRVVQGLKGIYADKFELFLIMSKSGKVKNTHLTGSSFNSKPTEFTRFSGLNLKAIYEL